MSSENYIMECPKNIAKDCIRNNYPCKKLRPLETPLEIKQDFSKDRAEKISKAGVEANPDYIGTYSQEIEVEE